MIVNFQTLTFTICLLSMTSSSFNTHVTCHNMFILHITNIFVYPRNGNTFCHRYQIFYGSYSTEYLPVMGDGLNKFSYILLPYFNNVLLMTSSKGSRLSTTFTNCQCVVLSFYQEVYAPLGQWPQHHCPSGQKFAIRRKNLVFRKSFYVLFSLLSFHVLRPDTKLWPRNSRKISRTSSCHIIFCTHVQTIA